MKLLCLVLLSTCLNPESVEYFVLKANVVKKHNSSYMVNFKEAKTPKNYCFPNKNENIITPKGFCVPVEPKTPSKTISQI